MIKFISIDKLANFISSKADYNSCIISMDGVDGSGKFYLSIYLKKTKYQYIDIDGEYLIPNTGKYVGYFIQRKINSLWIRIFIEVLSLWSGLSVVDVKQIEQKY
jgi:hypothetical protein